MTTHGTWRAAGLGPLLVLLAFGCAVSKGEFKQTFDYEPVRASGRIDAGVELHASHAVAPEVAATWKRFGNPQENIDNWQAAVAEAIEEDMARSGLFGPQGSSKAGADLLLKVESLESEIPERRLRITLSVLDPRSKAVIARYERSAGLGTSLLAYGDNMKRGLSSLLAALRQDLLADYQAGKIRNALVAARAGSAAQGRLAAAQAARARGDYAAALVQVRQALVADPTGDAPVAAAVELLQALCDTEGAKRLGEEARRARRTDPAPQAATAAAGIAPFAPACQAQQLNKDGVALAREGRRAEALAKFQAARAIAPGLVPKASYNAAILLEQGGKPQETAAAYIEAHQGFLISADQQEALSRLAAAAQRANLGVPETADRRYRLGIVRAQQKRYPEAVTEFEAAIAEAPWLADAHYNLGLVYDFTDAPAAALQAFRTYLGLAPQSPHASAVKTKVVELEDKLGSEAGK